MKISVERFVSGKEWRHLADFYPKTPDIKFVKKKILFFSIKRTAVDLASLRQKQLDCISQAIKYAKTFVGRNRVVLNDGKSCQVI